MGPYVNPDDVKEPLPFGIGEEVSAVRLVLGFWTTRAGPLNLEHRTIFESNRGQLSAPYTSAINRQEMGFEVQPQCGPVAANDGDIRMAAMWDLEPGKIAGGRLFERAGEPRHLTGGGAGS